MNSKGNAPTMKDVAREAGVALGTVSKVFNGISVGESYRKRVLEAAERLGYQVNNYARGLRSNQTRVVALILPGVAHPFFASLCESVSHALSKRGYRMLLALTGSDYTAEQSCIQMVQQNKVDGMIGLTYSSDLQVSETIPYVSIDRCLNSTIPCITSDNYEGGRLAAQKLAELGCRRLLFLRTGSVVGGETDKRGIGFEAYCRQNDIPCDSFRCNDEDGVEAVEGYLDQNIMNGVLNYDGIFCNTDHLALMTQELLLRRRIRVPEEVQIIGFDGIRLFPNLGYACSTIVQPVEQMAEMAVDILLREKEKRLAGLYCLPVTYQAGGTTRDFV